MHIDEKVLTCCAKDCAISFAVPSWWESGKRETKTTFYCPNGHAQSFKGETEADKFRRQRDSAIQEQARLADEAREATARAIKAEAAAKRLKKRAAAGTCPCCQRSFGNMAEHMKHQHPGWVRSTGANVTPLKRSA